MDEATLRRLDERQERINRIGFATTAAGERLWQGLLPAWIAGSNALDGNRLTLAETEQLLLEGGTHADYSVREHLEALNHREAIGMVRRLARGPRPANASTVRRLHATLLAGIDDENAGRYRRYVMEGAEAPALELMQAWEAWLEGTAAELHPLERACRAHHRLLQIQPFMDGNGRVARLILNLGLLQDGYLPAVLNYEDRHDYRDVVYRADCGDLEPMLGLVCRALNHVQTMYLLALER